MNEQDVYFVEGFDHALTQRVVAYLKVEEVLYADDDSGEFLVTVQGYNDLGEKLPSARVEEYDGDRFERLVNYETMSEGGAQKRAQADQGAVGPEDYGTQNDVSRSR